MFRSRATSCSSKVASQLQLPPIASPMFGQQMLSYSILQGLRWKVSISATWGTQQLQSYSISILSYFHFTDSKFLDTYVITYVCRKCLEFIFLVYVFHCCATDYYFLYHACLNTFISVANSLLLGNCLSLLVCIHEGRGGQWWPRVCDVLCSGHRRGLCPSRWGTSEDASSAVVSTDSWVASHSLPSW